MNDTTDLQTADISSASKNRYYPFPQRFIYVEMVLFSLISTLMIFAWIPAIMSIFTYAMILPSALRAAIFLNIYRKHRDAEG